MSEGIEEKADSHPRSAMGMWVFWVGAALVLYGLSSGPVIRFEHSGRLGRGAAADVVAALYYPFMRAYEDTALHKPLGLYLHFWLPYGFDGQGEVTGACIW